MYSTVLITFFCSIRAQRSLGSLAAGEFHTEFETLLKPRGPRNTISPTGPQVLLFSGFSFQKRWDLGHQSDDAAEGEKAK